MLSAIAATLAIVALGYFLKQRNFLPDSVWQAMSPLCYWVLFPGLLFDLMSKMELSATFIGRSQRRSWREARWRSSTRCSPAALPGLVVPR